MLLLQLKYESLRLLRSPLLWLLFAFLLGSVGFALFNASQRFKSRMESYRQVLTDQSGNFELLKMQADSTLRGLRAGGGWRQDPTIPIAVVRAGRIISLQPIPESIIATGISDLQPDAWRLSLFQSQSLGDTELENPVNLVFGIFDLAFVIVYLLPLLVIALSFNLISSEREQGTLDLQRAQPISFSTLFAQKMMVRFVLLAGITLAVILPLLIYQIGWASLLSVLAATGIALLYVLFWFLVVLAVNLRGGSSAQNALWGICAWLAFTVIIPAVVNMVAQKIHPIPSRASFQVAMRDLDKQLEDSRENRIKAFYTLNPQYKLKPDSEKGWEDFYREALALNVDEKRLRDSVEQLFAYHADKQEAFASRLMLLSPALSTHRQLTDISGTSREAFRNLTVRLEDLQADWTAWFKNKLESGQRLSTRDYETVMAFPDKVMPGKIQGLGAGAILLLFQCLLAAICVWRYSL
jgi:ABC-2 type transport system permease protein